MLVTHGNNLINEMSKSLQAFVRKDKNHMKSEQEGSKKLQQQSNGTFSLTWSFSPIFPIRNAQRENEKKKIEMRHSSILNFPSIQK